jgi:hypothetical protein
MSVNKENFDLILQQLVDLANQKPGTFREHECYALQQCIEALNPDMIPTAKPLENDPDPQKTARTKLLVGARKGHANGAYRVPDSALLFRAIEFWNTDPFGYQKGKEPAA